MIAIAVLPVRLSFTPLLMAEQLKGLGDIQPSQSLYYDRQCALLLVETRSTRHVSAAVPSTALCPFYCIHATSYLFQ